MKEKGYLIRSYEKGDEVSINKGFNEVFHLKRPIAEWKWKFDPEGNNSSIIVAVNEENRVLAHYAATIVDLTVNGKIYKCGQPVDVYSVKQKGSIQHRLYLKSAAAFYETFGAKDKIQFFFGFPSARVFKLGQIKLDYGNFVPVVVGKKSVRNRKLIFKKIPTNYNCNLDAVEELWHRSSYRYPVSIVRNAKYIKRRYLDRPKNKYFYLTIEQGHETKVLSILEYNKFSIKWIDLIWDGDNGEHLIAMDELVEKVTRTAGVGSMEMWIANDQKANDIFIERGWEFSPHGDLYLAAKCYHPNLDPDKFINEFYFTMGDSDLV